MKFQINITLQINKQINKATYEISKSYWRYIFKKKIFSASRILLYKKNHWLTNKLKKKNIKKILIIVWKDKIP